MLTKQQILDKINTIPDPDLGISIVELGLIYDVSVKSGIINIKMTLTTPACPLGGTLEHNIHKVLDGIEGVKNVNVEFTFEPLWSVDSISEETKLKLGIL